MRENLADKYNAGYDEMEAMSNSPDKAINYAIYGLLTDGGHHKQWFLEQILESLNINLEHLKIDLENDGYEWEPGTPP